MGVVVITTLQLLKGFVDIHEDDDINNGDEKEEESRDGCADQPTKGFEIVKVADGDSGDCNEDGQQHHDSGMAKREEEADGDRSFILLHQLAGDIIYGRDMVCIEPVTQAKRKGR